MRALMILTLLLLPNAVLALSASEMFDDPEKEARAREIGRQLRCLVCRNQSIFDSNAGIAEDLRIVVRERMEAGETDAEILAFVRSKFGDYVLLKPPVTMETSLLWGAPFVLISFSALGFAVFLRGRVRRPETTISDEERAQAKSLLGMKEGKL